MPSITELCKQFETEVDTHHLDTVFAYFSSPTKKVLLTQLKEKPSLLREIGNHISVAKEETSVTYGAKMMEAWGLFLQEYRTMQKIPFNDILFSWAKEAPIT
jgi:hypothetical protein